MPRYVDIMGEPTTLGLTPTEAAGYLLRELAEADEAFRAGVWDVALDGHVRALGLALQMGPIPTEQVFVSILQTTRRLVPEERPRALASLGPALVDLIRQVQQAGAIPSTKVMEAWALFSSDVGALVGQVGLALTLSPNRRGEFAANARRHAVLLDDATGGSLGLTAWLDAIVFDPKSPAS